MCVFGESVSIYAGIGDRLCVHGSRYGSKGRVKISNSGNDYVSERSLDSACLRRKHFFSALL